MESTSAAAVASLTPMASEQASNELGDFDALVRAEQRRIYRVLLAMLRDPDAADSLTQESFLKAYKSRKGFRGECSPRTWLLRIAVNLARDHLRNRKLQFWRQLFQVPETKRVLEPADLRATPEQVLLAKERLDAVWSAVERLSGQQRMLFLLRFVEEMSIEEIAEVTALRPGTVKAHLFRALGTIRRRTQEKVNQ
jgi:RNA polymerase sigma-70 factor (ECF subfamily)